jgi:ribokinase
MSSRRRTHRLLPFAVVGAVGEDGAWVKDRLKGYGVDVSEIAVVEDEVTGRAIIQLSKEDGENSISAFPSH